MAGVAGALYVPQVGIIGALLVNAGKSYFTGALPEYWLFALGGLFIVVTLFLPKGIVGVVAQWRNRIRRPAKPQPPEPLALATKPNPEPAE
jgi:urea transport system permease protein